MDWDEKMWFENQFGVISYLLGIIIALLICLSYYLIPEFKKTVDFLWYWGWRLAAIAYAVGLHIFFCLKEQEGVF